VIRMHATLFSVLMYKVVEPTSSARDAEFTDRASGTFSCSGCPTEIGHVTHVFRGILSPSRKVLG
jgi:hypothetical protein